MAVFIVMGDSVEYTVNASNMQGVTAGHIHSGKQGEKWTSGSDIIQK